jgi:hypothetical protein
MKIRKFNEAVEPIDIEYIRQCFIDLIEEGKAEVIPSQLTCRVTLSVKAFVKMGEFGGVNLEKIGSGTYFERCVKEAEESVKTMKMATESIARLADEYPEYYLSAVQASDKIWLTITQRD